MKTKLYSILGGILTTLSLQQVQAQNQAAVFLKAGQEDANKLMGAYMKPLLDGFATSMSNGWYNTARPHGIGGFDITFNLNVVSIGSDMKTYNPSSIGLNTDPSKPRLQFANPNDKGQTIYGDKETVGNKIDVVQNVMGTDTVISSFTMPSGLGTPYGIGLPNIQAAVGVGFGTEVMLRVTPSLTASDFKISMFGFGVKHSLSHWIFKGDSKPPIDLSLIFGMNTLSADYAMGENYLKPDSAYPGALADNVYKDSQKFTFEGKGLMFGGIVSKKLSVLTLYAGANYNVNSVEMKVAGKYPVTFLETEPSNPNFGQKIILNFSDPITLKSELGFMRYTLGARLKLLFLTVSGEYHIGPVNMFSAGVGINFQSMYPFKL